MGTTWLLQLWQKDTSKYASDLQVITVKELGHMFFKYEVARLSSVIYHIGVI